MSQQTLGNITGYTQEAISHFETERRKLSLNGALCFAELFGVTIDYVLGRDERIEYSINIRDGNQRHIDIEVNNEADLKKLICIISNMQINKTIKIREINISD